MLYNKTMMREYPMTFDEFVKQFSTEEQCREYLFQLRWSNGFECPHCKSKYSDADDKYLKRCEKNRSWTTKINCKCGKPFFMTYDYKGDAVSFV